jgi:hypothetical protein
MRLKRIASPWASDDAGYDTAVERPSPEELVRIARALGLGAALGVVLAILGRRRADG